MLWAVEEEESRSLLIGSRNDSSVLKSRVKHTKLGEDRSSISSKSQALFSEEFTSVHLYVLQARDVVYFHHIML